MAEFDNKFAYLKALHGAGLDASEYRVLVTLLDYSDGHGRNAHPGRSTLATDCELSESTIKRSIKSLQRKGFIREESRGGRGGENGRNQASCYTLTLPATTGHSRPEVTHDLGSYGTRPRVTGDTEGGHPRPPGGVTRDPVSDQRSDQRSECDQSAPARTTPTAAEDAGYRCSECLEQFDGHPPQRHLETHAPVCATCCPF
ncbi:helix-turn-helix domain-containing protein [Mycobacterium yunnanensis]|uniref:Helix-turn-helix domain-containing protein n=1 Tax=Mycobacterium yunnanensis TaxID=368477 RepID=A0A9X2Z4P8_9MYCO|nr:helix-turn-helix domain-containing protein [Mycobacterium yunnanensis]